MQSKCTSIYWLLVFFLCKSTGLAAEVNPYSHCPLDPRAHGIYTIMMPSMESFQVFCDARIAGPGWTVIARRTNGELNFYRSWEESKRGFGDLGGNFFIGLDKLHAITKSETHELYVHLEDFEGNTRYAKYDEFLIESEKESYKMSKLGAYSGDAGDSMFKCRNQKFTTYDRDNDQWPEGNCAHDRMSPWWHLKCGESSLFGMYMRGATEPGMLWKGVRWAAFHGDYSHKVMQMMVRHK
ncbi:ficolin-1-like [Drosophila guanche]|uniref:Blast:Techylectin-5B n=2 Tax=Drosophila guanche TaxID=7266 RepID=A0A3B0JIQ7_DROGU|nr:ficolin-1-like [Drosophila guanche]SPP82304.1 blast:Techylectin-5B [Drosophila guanche]